MAAFADTYGVKTRSICNVKQKLEYAPKRAREFRQGTQLDLNQ
jgi:hypothetical protein